MDEGMICFTISCTLSVPKKKQDCSYEDEAFKFPTAFYGM